MIYADIRHETRKIKNLTQSNFLRVKNRSGYRINSYRTGSGENNSLENISEEFGRLHKEFVRSCEKFFSHECNRLVINNELYKELLHFSSVARYRLLYLHREAQLLFRKYSESYWKATVFREATPHEKHVANMTKVLSEKYNLISKVKAKEPQPMYFFSQPNSPERRGRSSLKSR